MATQDVNRLIPFGMQLHKEECNLGLHLLQILLS
jgi:hypothetical protein